MYQQNTYNFWRKDSKESFFVVLNNVTMHKCCTGVKSLLNSRYHNIVAFLHILGWAAFLSFWYILMKTQCSEKWNCIIETFQALERVEDFLKYMQINSIFSFL